MLRDRIDVIYHFIDDSRSEEGIVPCRVIDCAAQRGHLGMVDLLLKSGASMTCDTLHFAVASGNKDLMLLLLTWGADPNSLGSRLRAVNQKSIESVHITPLAAAVRLQDEETLKLLEEHGASFTMQSEAHFSAAFFAAVDVGNVQLLEHFVQLKGETSAIVDSKLTLNMALQEATSRRQDEVAKILTDISADESFTSPFRARSPHGDMLIHALERRKESLALSLIDAGLDFAWYSGEELIELAAEWGNLSVIKALFFEGVEVDKPESILNLVLIIAVKRQDYELIRLVLFFGADINSKGQGDCVTALTTAVESGDINMVSYLLDQGADPKDVWAYEKAALDDERLSDLLFKRYRERYPQDRGDFGFGVLRVAIGRGNERVIRLMLERGVNANRFFVMDDEHITPFGLAIVMQQDNLTGYLELFLQHGSNPNVIVSRSPINYLTGTHSSVTALLAAIGTRNRSTVELFLRYGGDVNFRLRGGIKRTPLQRAAEVGSIDILELLINHGAKINAPAATRGGGTALQLAAIGGYIPIACKLLSLKADVNAPAAEIDGRTALEGAAEHGRLDMLQLLLNGGAGSGPGQEGQIAKAILLAEDNCHYPITDLLRSVSSIDSEGQGGGLGVPVNENDDEIFNFMNLDGDPLSL